MTETETETVKEPEVELDVDAMLSSLVSVRSEVPEDALTAPVLGTERMGNGVVIGDRGLVLTIGYLVTEAQTLWITDHRGAAVPGHVLGYDQDSGFGLVQALQTLPVPPMELGVSAACDVGDPVVVAGHGGGDALVTGRIIAKREFAGYWEYVLGRSPVHRSGAPELGRRRARRIRWTAARRRLPARADRLVERGRRGGRTWSFRSTC